MSHKHELQTNELATWLGEQVEAIQPHLKTIIGVAILGLVGILAFSVMQGQNEGREQAAWTNFFQAQAMGDAENAKEVARQFANTEAAAWAWQWAGDYELTQASSEAFTDKAESLEGLTAAMEAYEAALKSSPPAVIQQRSKLGLAQVYEGLNELDKAQAEYEEVAKRWPDSHVAKVAEDRIAFLQMPETKEFANWFAKQKPRDRSGAAATPSGIQLPSATDDLSTDSDLMLPDASAIEGARSSAEFDSMTPPDAQPETPTTEMESAANEDADSPEETAIEDDAASDTGNETAGSTDMDTTSTEQTDAADADSATSDADDDGDQ